MRIGYIYAILHRNSGRRYIGSSFDPDRRWTRHKSDLNRSRHLGLSQAKIAKQFKVCQKTISKIARRVTWSHV